MKEDYASKKYYSVVSPSFIKRDIELEKEIGIENINLYAYWVADFEGVLLIVGEIESSKPLTGRFSLQCRKYDKDDDLIEVLDNFSYTGGNGFDELRIMPELFYNKYPFKMELHFDKNKIDGKIKLIPVIDESDEEEFEQHNLIDSVSTLDISRILNKQPTELLLVGYMKKSEKFPKDMIQYVVETYTGVDSIKCVFFKSEESKNEYYANQISYTTIVSGKLKERTLIYYLFYNDKGQLIQYELTDLPKKKYTEKCYKEITNMPPSEKVSRIIVYVGSHPSLFCNRPEALWALEKLLQ